MERNDDQIGNIGSSTGAGASGSSSAASGGFGNSGDLTGSAGYGGSGSGSTSDGAYGAGSASGTGGSSYGTSSGAGVDGAGSAGSSSSASSTSGSSGMSGDGAAVTERARELAGGARERLADAGSTLRERAGGAKNSLADMLEAGANRLNSQGGAAPLAAGAGSATAGSADNRLAAVAGGLQGSADWLREADLDGLRSGIENQVKTNPGRSMLLAVGLGYLVGKAFRR